MRQTQSYQASIFFILLLLTMEVLKDIIGYEWLYKISNYGNVYSINFRWTGEQKQLSTSLRWQYLRIWLFKNKVQKDFSVHRLVCEAFVPNPFNKRCVNHKDGNKLNNKSDNLERCTIKENVLHMYHILWYKHTPRQREVASVNWYKMGKMNGIIVHQYTLQYEYIRTFNSFCEASKHTWMCRTSIARAAKASQAACWWFRRSIG